MRTNAHYSKFLWRIVWIAALLIRFIGIEQSVWLDEAVVAQTVRHLSFAQILTQFSPTDFHPPVYYLFMKAWTWVFGISEMSLRMPSVLFSLVTGYVVYRFAFALCTRGNESTTEHARTTAAVAATLFLFNPLIVYYSQEARMYMAVTCFASLLLYSIWPLFKNGKAKLTPRQIVLANVMIALLIATFYGSIFFVSSLYILLAYGRRWRDLLRLLPGLLSSLLLLTPLLVRQLHHAKAALAAIHGWSLVLGRAEFRNLVLVPVKVLSGRYDLHTQTDYLLVGGILFLFIAILIRSVWNKYTQDDSCIHEAGQMGALVLLPVVLGYAVSFFKPQMQYFRFLYIVVPLSVAVSIVVVKKELRVVLVALFMMFSWLYVSNPARHREDWRSLAASLPPLATVYMIPASSDPIGYYRPDVRVVDVAAVTASHDVRVFVVPYVFAVYGIDENVLLKRHFTIQKVNNFRGLTYEVWRRSESR